MQLDSQCGCAQMTLLWWHPGQRAPSPILFAFWRILDVSRICSLLDHFLLLFFICNLFFMKVPAFPEHTEVRAYLINPNQGCASSRPGSCLLPRAVLPCVWITFSLPRLWHVFFLQLWKACPLGLFFLLFLLLVWIVWSSITVLQITGLSFGASVSVIYFIFSLGI